MSRLFVLSYCASLVTVASNVGIIEAVPIRSTSINSHHRILDTGSSGFTQVSTAPTAEAATDGEFEVWGMRGKGGRHIAFGHSIGMH